MRVKRAGLACAWLASVLLAGAAPKAFAQTAPATPPATPASATSSTQVTLLTPEMLGALTFPPQPTAIDTGPFGKWYADAVFSGLALAQNQPDRHDEASLLDASNGQVIVQKIDGLLQFYVQAGAYALPSLGTQYNHVTNAGATPAEQFGIVPQTYVKLAPSNTFSVQFGKLPSLVGAEDTFTFEGYNIERGLLWNLEPAINRGAQANLTLGHLALSVSLNDGFYSNRYTWLSGSATYAASSASTFVLAAAGNLSRSSYTVVATPLAQNNGTVFNAIYIFNAKPLTLTPYLQVTTTPADAAIGLAHGAATYGAALLASYAIAPAWGVAGRVEYITTSRARAGQGGVGQDAAGADATNLLYGPGSHAVSFTLTPTFTHDRFFARAEASVVAAGGVSAGDGFGRAGDASTQCRGMLEAGFVF